MEERPFDKSEEAKALFEAIGHTLNAWNYIERRLDALFCDCLHYGTRFPASRAYWAVHSFEVRLDMVSEVVSCQLARHKDKLADWNALYNRLKRRAKLRNKLAHGQVILSSPRDKSAPQAFLSPFHGAAIALRLTTPDREEREALFPKGRSKDHLYAKDIRAMWDTFSDDSAAVWAFHWDVAPLLLAAEVEQRGPSKAHEDERARHRATPRPQGKSPQPQS